MGILEKAANKTAFAKIGLYGDAGSGKTFTASCLAIGLHKLAKSTKPIGFFDTEPSLSYVLPIFKAAGIEVLCYDKSRALQDLMTFMKEAEQECSIVIIDSITHPWRDLQESYIKQTNEKRKKYGKDPINKIEFQDWSVIKSEWRKFTDRFLCSKLHVIVCGRMGDVYEYQKSERSDRMELITTGSKMATEKELGYEPALLVEMSKRRENGKITNVGMVVKDRSNWLNGDTLVFKPFKGVSMQKTQAVFDLFKKHFESIDFNAPHFDSMETRDSTALFPYAGGEVAWPSEQRKREIFSEEIQGLMVKYYPSQGAEDKKRRLELMEAFADTRSWTKVESLHSEKLEQILRNMKAFLESEHAVESKPAVEVNPVVESEPITEVIKNTSLNGVQNRVNPKEILNKENNQATIN